MPVSPLLVRLSRVPAGELRYGVLALAVYVAVAVLVVGVEALTTPRLVPGRSIDLPGTLWIHWWVAGSLGRGELPVHTDLLFYPEGKNFFHDTGANYVDALVGVPLQWLFGVPDFLDVLQVVLLTGNAVAMHALARTLAPTASRLAIFASAVAFEVNPFVVHEVAEGRPTQVMFWFGLLAARAFVRIPEDQGWRSAVAFGVFTALQGLTYWFSVYFLALALLPWALAQLWRAPRLVAPRLVLAVLTCLVLCSPFLVAIARAIDAGEVRRVGFETLAASPAGMPSRWHVVLQPFVTLGGGALLLVAIPAWRKTWPLVLGAAVCTVFGFGGTVDVVKPPLDNPLYAFAWDHVPLVQRLGFPDRAAVGTFLALSMAAALGLSRLPRLAAAAFPVLLLGELGWADVIPVRATSGGAPPDAVYIRDNPGPVIFLPLGIQDNAMVHQTVHGQPIFGGMGERETDMRPPAFSRRLENNFIRMLGGSLNDTEAPIAYSREERAEVARLYRWVWMDLRAGPPDWRRLGYDPRSKAERLRKELGAPVRESQFYLLWDLRVRLPEEAPGLSASAVARPDALTRLVTSSLHAAPGPKTAPAAGPPRERRSGRNGDKRGP
jgi:hypothetical protein